MSDVRDTSPIFCIVDPSLKDFVGHHFAYDESVARGATTAGFRAVTLAHRAVNEAIAGGTEVLRCFRRDMWADSELARYLPTQVRAAANAWLTNRDFLTDLRAGLHRLTMPPGSILFAHMVFRNQLAALAEFVRDQPAQGPLEIILLLRYQPAFYDNPLCARAFRRLEKAAAAGRRIRLASDSTRLSRELSRLTKLPIEVMPIPHTVEQSAVQAARPPDAPLRFVSLGNARDEKGYVEILDAIRLLHANGELEGLEFVLQSNDAAPDVRGAIDAFVQECPQGVTLLHEALSPEEYNAQLMAADVVLVPYWREIYQARTSGVFLESVAAGKVVVATRDTWMSDELERFGAGVLVDDHDHFAIAAAIRTVRRDHARLANLAEPRRSACLAHHNPGALVHQAMHGAAPDALPGRDVGRVALLFPWGDFLDRRSGASVRCNLLVDKISPMVEEIWVLQDGPANKVPEPWKIVTKLLALSLMLPAKVFALSFTRLLQRRAAGAAGPANVVHTGNVRVEMIPPRVRQHIARRLFRAPFRFLQGRHFGQEMLLWYFLERRLDPLFAAKVREMVTWADVVLLEYPFWASIVAPICRSLGKPLIITNYDVLAQQVTGSRALRRLTARLERQGLASGDHAVCVSEDDRTWFANAGVETLVIPNPVDCDRLAEPVPGDPRILLHELYDISLPPGPICLFVGSLFGPNIEAAEQIKVMAARLSHSSGPVGFVIAGACAEPARGRNWVALGRVEEGALVALYQLAALVLVPLRAGTGSSVKTVEALAMGKPVLGTSKAFRGLHLRPGRDCSQQDDLARWPAQIVDLLAAPGRLAAMSSAARIAGAAFDYRLVFEAYAALIGFRHRTSGGGGANSLPRHTVSHDLVARAIARDRLEVAAMLLANPAVSRDLSDGDLLLDLLAAALRLHKLPVALAAAEWLEDLGVALRPGMLHGLVMLASNAGQYNVAETFLQRLLDEPTRSRSPAMRQLDRALTQGEFEKAQALLKRLKHEASPLRAVNS